MDIAVYDVAGRHVATLLTQGLPSRSRSIVWDGRTSSGMLAPAGVYFLRVEAGRSEVSQRLARLR